MMAITGPPPGEILFDTVNYPHRSSRSIDVIYSPYVKTYLTVHDSVVVQSYKHCPPVVGKIIKVSDYFDSYVSNHPYLTKCYHMFCVMYYEIKDDVPDFQDLWPAVPTAQQKYFHSMQEAAKSNHIVYINPKQIKSFAFLIHEKDIREQSFGPVAGIAHCYFI